jgi:hypothetical protein
MSAPTYQGIHNLPTIARGDTLPSWSVAINRNGSPAVITSARLKIRSRAVLAFVDALACTISSGNTVIVAEAGAAKTATWPIGTHNYDLEVTLSTGLVRTYLSGTITITRDDTF